MPTPVIVMLAVSPVFQAFTALVTLQARPTATPRVMKLPQEADRPVDDAPKLSDPSG
ncbi:hypothetical protein ACQP2F_02645 [Actinoplanes sp. CA-030573]|uniref:hypothetical protein n=1 Tax=Actinoplanes sp. CA-030573 TaxID=3239898 RepID=UPI003D946910